MKKRLLTGVVLALCLSVPLPAKALGNGPATKIIADCSLPEIQVTVPATAEVFFNPYQMPVEINGDSIRDQIVSAPAAIENESLVPIEVTATVSGTVWKGSRLRLSQTSTGGSSSTNKDAFIYFEMKAAPADSVSPSYWDSSFDAEKHVVVQRTSATRKNIVTLDQADKPNHFGIFRLTGDCVRSPRGGWTEDDGVDVKIAFTFKPLPRDNS